MSVYTQRRTPLAVRRRLEAFIPPPSSTAGGQQRYPIVGTGSVLIDPVIRDEVKVSRPPQDLVERADVALAGVDFRSDGGHYVAGVGRATDSLYSPPAGYGPSDRPMPYQARRTDHNVEPEIKHGSILDPPPANLDAPPLGYTPKVTDVIVFNPPSQFKIGEQDNAVERLTERITSGKEMPPPVMRQALIAAGLSSGIEYLAGHQHILTTGAFSAGSTAVTGWVCPSASVYKPLVSGVLAAGGHTLYGSPQSFMYLFLLQAGTDFVASGLARATGDNPFVATPAQRYAI